MLMSPPLKMNPVLQLGLPVPWPLVHRHEFFSPFQLPHMHKISIIIVIIHHDGNCHHIKYGYLRDPRLCHVPVSPQPSLPLVPACRPHFTLALVLTVVFQPLSSALAAYAT